MTQKRALILKHAAHEGAGTIRAFLSKREIELVDCDLFSNTPVPKKPQADALIVMGGPMNADEVSKYPFLASEKVLISKYIQAGKPVVGICLGAQLIARTLGARVYRGTQKEIGWGTVRWEAGASSDPVFQSFANQETQVLHWHGDTFDLPEGAVRLASSCLYPNQAFRYQNHVYAFQFHIEITPEMLNAWIPVNQTELKLVYPHVTAEKILKASKRCFPDLEAFSDLVYSKLFLTLGLISDLKKTARK